MDMDLNDWIGIDCGLLCSQPFTSTEVSMLEHYKSLGLFYYDIYICISIGSYSND